MTIFIGYSESLRILNRDQSRLRGLISIALSSPHLAGPNGLMNVPTGGGAQKPALWGTTAM
jgi:hypothetical protein